MRLRLGADFGEPFAAEARQPQWGAGGRGWGGGGKGEGGLGEEEEA
jgi:hypothetical protein